MKVFLIAGIVVSCAFFTAFSHPLDRSCECSPTESVGPDCTADQMRILWPDCNDNSGYFQCTAIGSYQRMPCAPGTVFGFYNQTCVHPEDFIEPLYCSTGEVPEWPEEPEVPDGEECVCENEEEVVEEPEEEEPENEECVCENEEIVEEPEEQEPEEQEPEEQEPEEQEPEEQEPEEQEPEEEVENEECPCPANDPVKDELVKDNSVDKDDFEDNSKDDNTPKDEGEKENDKEEEHEEDIVEDQQGDYKPAVEALPDIQFEPPQLSPCDLPDIEFNPPILTKV